MSGLCAGACTVRWTARCPAAENFVVRRLRRSACGGARRRTTTGATARVRQKSHDEGNEQPLGTRVEDDGDDDDDSDVDARGGAEIFPRRRALASASLAALTSAAARAAAAADDDDLFGLDGNGMDLRALMTDAQAFNRRLLRQVDPRRAYGDQAEAELEEQLGVPQGEPVNPPGVTPGDPDQGERDIVTTASGLSYADVVLGGGEPIKTADLVVAHVVGRRTGQDVRRVAYCMYFVATSTPSPTARLRTTL